MRNSRQRRNISVTIAVVAVSTLVVTLVTHEKGTGPGTWFGVVLASFFTSIFSVVASITFQLHHHWQQQLLRGEKLLAKWTVLPAEWQQFLINDKPRIDAERRNAIKVRRERESIGIEVTVAQDSLMIDDDFYKLVEIEDLQYLPETPPCLEYNMVTRGKNASVRWNIRFPVAASAEAGARAIWDYVYRPKPRIDLNLRLKRYQIARVVGLVMFLISVPALVFGYQHRGQMHIQTLVLTTLIVGFMGTPLGLFVGALFHVRIKSTEREVLAAGQTKT